MRKTRILLVDDNPRNLFIMEKILSKEYALLSVTSGEDALDRLSGFRPDLILLDIMMSGIDGYVTCRRMRSMPGYGRPKIIMVSAKAMVSERLEGYAAGADDYITKPFNADELLAKVRVYDRLKSTEELEQLRGALFTLLRHETQTPISIVKGALELMVRGEPLTTRQTELVTMAQTASDRLRRLIDRTVLLSGMRAGFRKRETSRMVLEPALRDLTNGFRSAIEARQQHLEVQIDGETEVEVDSGFVQNTFGEILANAVTAAPVGGRISVTARRKGDMAEVVIENTGTIPDPDALQHAFVPFWVRDLDHHSRGHGLGLSIALEATLQNGGTIDSTVTPDSVRFVIVVPVLHGRTGDSHGDAGDDRRPDGGDRQAA